MPARNPDDGFSTACPGAAPCARQGKGQASSLVHLLSRTRLGQRQKPKATLHPLD